MTNFVIPPNKAVVGSNVFSHGAGLHQDGMLKDINMYEIIIPAKVGAPGRTLPITRHSGRKGLAARVKELGIMVSLQDINKLYDILQEKLGDQKFIRDSDLLREVSNLNK